MQKLRREYDIAKRGDGLFNIWRWMVCPITPPLRSTPIRITKWDKDRNFTPEFPETRLIHQHHRWVIVEVRKTFKSALKWIKQQTRK